MLLLVGAREQQHQLPRQRGLARLLPLARRPGHLPRPVATWIGFRRRICSTWPEMPLHISASATAPAPNPARRCGGGSTAAGAEGGSRAGTHAHGRARSDLVPCAACWTKNGAWPSPKPLGKTTPRSVPCRRSVCLVRAGEAHERCPGPGRQCQARPRLVLRIPDVDLAVLVSDLDAVVAGAVAVRRLDPGALGDRPVGRGVGVDGLSSFC